MVGEQPTKSGSPLTMILNVGFAGAAFWMIFYGGLGIGLDTSSISPLFYAAAVVFALFWLTRM